MPTPRSRHVRQPARIANPSANASPRGALVAICHLTRRSALGGALAGALVTALGACSGSGEPRAVSQPLVDPIAWRAEQPVRQPLEQDDPATRPVPDRGAAPVRAARRQAELALDPDVTPRTRRYHPRIASPARGSISVGSITDGYLADGVEVPPEGPHHRIIAQADGRQTNETTDEMRALLLCAAERVAKAHPEHKLHLGNLSRHGGGDIQWSVSHNSGRDADIAFLSVGEDGRPLAPTVLHHFGRDMEASEDDGTLHRFDVVANWTLVRALIECPSPGVTHLFAARWLRHAMLRHARERGASPKLIAKARRLVRQPHRAMAHDDHLHVRISCPPDDIAEGCLERGRGGSERMAKLAAVQRRLPKLRRALRRGAPDERAGAAYLLGLYHDRRAARGLRQALSDEAPAVRERAAGALAAVFGGAAAGTLDARLEVETHAGVAAALIDALAEVGARELLAARLTDARRLRGDGFATPELCVRRRVLNTLGHLDALAVGPAVVPLLADPEPSVRVAARHALERLANRSTASLRTELEPFDATGALATADPRDAVGAQRLWYAFFESLPLDASVEDVVRSGFLAAGIELGGLGRRDIPALAEALVLGAPWRDNASVWIARALDYHPETGRGARAQPARFWLPWLARRRFISRASKERLFAVLDPPSAGETALVHAATAL